MRPGRMSWWSYLRLTVVVAIVALAVGQGRMAVAQTDSDEFDFSTLDGIQRAVARNYSGDFALLATPESAPATTYQIAAIVVEFDTADHAAAALEPLLADAQARYATDPPITMERVDPGDLGDQAVADFGRLEEDGLTYELALVVVQADTYLYMVGAVGIGTDTGALETATAFAQVLLDADAGSGEETFDEGGASIGGLWDKLPVGGDEVLGGLIPDEDVQVYP